MAGFLGLLLAPRTLGMTGEVMSTTVERMIVLYAVEDDEWALLLPFMPTKVHNTGSKTDWRHVANCLIAKCGLPNCSWRKIPHASTIRMAFHRSIDYGTWSAIERALPRLNLSRLDLIKPICLAAHRMKGGRR